MKLGLLRWVWVCQSICLCCPGERRGWDGEGGGVLRCVLKNKGGVWGPQYIWGGGRVSFGVGFGRKANLVGRAFLLFES